MKVKTGYLYHIKDKFFDVINDKEIMINHENNHSRPSYLAIKDKDILWFIPLSSRVDKYTKIIEHKKEKYGRCRTILIRKIADKQQAILIQNAFPTLEKYIKSQHMVNGKIIKIPSSVQKEILSNFNSLLALKKQGINLFFTDIDKIKEIISNELYTTSK